MAEGPDTLVFIPAWNEEENLPAVLRELRREIPKADILVVDDGSTDRTAHVAREFGAEVLSFGENRGLRAAVHSSGQLRQASCTVEFSWTRTNKNPFLGAKIPAAVSTLEFNLHFA